MSSNKQKREQKRREERERKRAGGAGEGVEEVSGKLGVKGLDLGDPRDGGRG